MLACSDFLAVSLSFMICILIRYALDGQFYLISYLKLWPIIFLFLLTFAAAGAYRVLTAPPMELKRCTLGVCFMFLFLAAITFWSRNAESYSRAILFSACIMTCFLVPIGRRVCHNLFSERKGWRLPAIIFGDTEVAFAMVKTLQEDPTLGLKPVALVHGGKLSETNINIPIYTRENIPSLAKKYPYAYFFIAQPDFTLKQYQKLLAETDHYFSKTIIAPDIFRQANMWAYVIDINGILALETGQKLFSFSSHFQKRAMDVAFSLGGIALLMPLFFLIGVLIKIDTKGSVFYYQKRVGRDGIEFKLWKFRTMVNNADAVLNKELKNNASLRAEWENKQKLKVDPRITRVGGFLRKSSLDELPQLWNVLRGDMSLVGPRPIVESEIEKYASSYELYTKVLPGMTGLWQISGRSALSYAERVRLDTYYIRNWSTWFDLYILSRTPGAVIKCFGAY